MIANKNLITARKMQFEVKPDLVIPTLSSRVNQYLLENGSEKEAINKYLLANRERLAPGHAEFEVLTAEDGAPKLTITVYSKRTSEEVDAFNESVLNFESALAELGRTEIIIFGKEWFR